MPSRARQGVIVLKNNNPRKPGSYILIAKKTGFIDVTVNNTRYYYNKSDHYPMTQKKNVSSFITPASKKRTIVITRKR